MLCTAIHDAYQAGEQEDVRAALERLTAPSQPDWSPKGVYAYWNHETHEILYLGLSVNLPGRFAQHNGIVKSRSGDKARQIAAHLEAHGSIGFTVLLQAKAIELMEQIARLDWTLGATGAGVIAMGEGQLIETHRLVYGQRPPWNAMGGAVRGRQWATAAPELLEVLAAARPSLFSARHSIRAVAEDLELRLFEATVHGARMRALMEAHEISLSPPLGDEQEAMRRIQKSLLLRDGRLADNLDVADDDIRRWVHLLGDPETWQREAQQRRSLLDQPLPRPRTPSEDAVLELLDAMVADAAPQSHILATAELLETGYLDRAVVLS
ncbi:MAG TPA: hypothetical protein VKB25_16030 [Conexibacter sp.]|nr:hypothetical protein [Conexibacter sp.]